MNTIKPSNLFSLHKQNNMKKILIAIAILLAASTVTFAQDSTSKKASHSHKRTASAKYTCSMHPEVVMNKPGKCPKCGMTLVKMKNKKTTKQTGEMKM